MKALIEIPIKEGNVFTSCKIVEDEINYVEKGEWDNEAQDWTAILVLKNGAKFNCYMPMYNKLKAIGD